MKIFCTLAANAARYKRQCVNRDLRVITVFYNLILKTFPYDLGSKVQVFLIRSTMFFG